MRDIQKDTEGISVIVGALMLVVITIGAAVAFAAFVSEQQAKYQQNQRLQQQSELERIIVNEFGFNTSGNVTSLHIQNTGINPVKIWSININDFIVSSCFVNNKKIILNGTNIITIESLDSITVQNINSTINKSGSITITIWTTLHSHEQTFYPPVALIQLDMTATPQICDGTKSYSMTNNSYILKWHWNIDNTTPPLDTFGPKITAGFSSGQQYKVILNVTDNFGMTATDTYRFTQP